MDLRREKYKEGGSKTLGDTKFGILTIAILTFENCEKRVITEHTIWENP